MNAMFRKGRISLMLKVTKSFLWVKIKSVEIVFVKRSGRKHGPTIQLRIGSLWIDIGRRQFPMHIQPLLVKNIFRGKLTVFRKGKDND